MKQMLYRTCVGLVLSSFALTVAAQQTSHVIEDTVPSAPSQILTSSAHADSNPLKSDSTSPSLDRGESVISNSNFVLRTIPSKKVVDKKFLFLNGLALGMAVFDVEMTQRCIASQHCQEKNPLMPSSHAGQLGLNLALVSGTTWLSYRQKEHNSKTWWIPPMMGSIVHSIGVATGFQHQ